jgi:hypothetical protein
MPRQNFRTGREIFAGDPIDLSLDRKIGHDNKHK